MSGRYFHAFLTSHRSKDTEKLTQRTQVGLYEQLQVSLEAKRLSSQLSEKKLQKVLCAAQVNKEKSLLRRHKQVWIQEQHRLNSARERAEKDFQNFLHGDRLECDSDVQTQLLEYELQLVREQEEFRWATVEPVCQLRDDLQHRLTTNQNSEPEEVLQQALFIRHQQEEIMDRLQSECVFLQQELSAAKLEEGLLSAGTGDPVADLEKIPDEILAGCPYPDLKSDLIHSFYSLNEKYKTRLEIVQARLQGLDRNCGWNEENHEMFQHIVSQYSPTLKNQRSLYTDMLQRVLPYITKQELNAHERCRDWYYFSLAQKRLVLQDWQRSHTNLLLRVWSVLEESRNSHLQQLELQNQHSQQQNICFQLREKVQQWRAQQEKAVELEASIAARWQREEEERLCKEEQKEKVRRTQQKQQVKQFHAVQQRIREEQRQKDMERLTEMRREMEKQKKRDIERVKYREGLTQQKIQKREAKGRQKEEEEKEREDRLQALRNQVSRVAEANTERMMGETVAWRGRQHPEEVFTLQRPLYQLNTYTDTQIVSDPRIRFEQALRSAGLDVTSYARQILAEIQPLKAPRRDMQSTAFRS